jgi:hypothetical protein
MKLLRIIPPQDWMLIRKNWILQAVHKSVIFFSILSLIVIVVCWTKLPPLLPLWYSRPWGVDQLAPPIFLLILPLASISVYTVNLLLSMYVLWNIYFAKLLCSHHFSILSCIAVIKIILLVL